MASLNPRHCRRRRKQRYQYTACLVSFGGLISIGYSKLAPAYQHTQATGVDGLVESFGSWTRSAETLLPQVSDNRRLSAYSKFKNLAINATMLSAPSSPPVSPGGPPQPPPVPAAPPSAGGLPPSNERAPPLRSEIKPPECGSQTKMERDGSLPALGFAEGSKLGMTIFEIVVMLYMFLGLAIVCDEYFETALEAICKAQGLQNDVAGATWMAAGGSAPELATSFVGTLISFSDVGFGTIVGSAVFNVLFVIACCAFVSPNLSLQWYPLARDVSYYCFGILMLVIFSGDGAVYWWEALILFALYIGYVMIMKHNVQFETWAKHRIELTNRPRNWWQAIICWSIKQTWFNFIVYTAILANTIIICMDFARGEQEVENGAAQFCLIRCVPDKSDDKLYLLANICFSLFFIVEMLYKWAGLGFFGYWRNVLNCFDGVLVFLIILEWVTYTIASNAPGGIGAVRALRITRFLRVARIIRVMRLLYQIFTSRFDPPKEVTTQVAPAELKRVGKEGEAKITKNIDAMADARAFEMMCLTKDAASAADELKIIGTKTEHLNSSLAANENKGCPSITSITQRAKPDNDGDDDNTDNMPANPFEIPESRMGKCFWAIGFPLSLLFFLTIPDCRRPAFQHIYMSTFVMSIIWIGALAFVMVWMATEFGILYELPASVMGITILAAGTSIPDCLSSIAVAKRGHGDMAVSSSIGSNIFDILVGLPVPWFIYGAIYQPLTNRGNHDYVVINSDGLTIMVRPSHHCLPLQARRA